MEMETRDKDKGNDSDSDNGNASDSDNGNDSGNDSGNNVSAGGELPAGKIYVDHSIGEIEVKRTDTPTPTPTRIAPPRNVYGPIPGQELPYTVPPLPPCESDLAELLWVPWLGLALLIAIVMIASRYWGWM